MDIRFVVSAALVALIVFFAYKLVTDQDGVVVVVENLPTEFQSACQAEPEMCRCVYEWLEFVASNEELMALNTRLVRELGHEPSIGEWASTWQTHRSPQVSEWLRESLNTINMPFFDRCLDDLWVAEQRAAGNPGLPTFEETARALPDGN